MSIKIRQSAKYSGQDWWKWSVWLDGPDTDLKKIEEVIYTLHPTFPDPVRHVRDYKTKFRLDSAGWGGFEIDLEIREKGGRQRRRKHWLTLEHPSEPATRAGSRSAAAEAKAQKPLSIFISSSISDTDYAQSLRKAFEKFATKRERDIKVIMPDDISSALPFDRQIDQMIAEADIAVFLISARRSPWIDKEIAAAQAHKVAHIVPVLIGIEARLPDALHNLATVRVTTPAELQLVAEQTIQAAGL